MEPRRKRTAMMAVQINFSCSRSEVRQEMLLVHTQFHCHEKIFSRKVIRDALKSFVQLLHSARRSSNLSTSARFHHHPHLPPIPSASAMTKNLSPVKWSSALLLELGRSRIHAGTLGICCGALRLPSDIRAIHRDPTKHSGYRGRR